jgi:anti-sigma B factor antagonist
MTGAHEPGSDFQLAIWQRDSQSVTVVLSGELDLASAPKLRSGLADLVANGIRHVIVDLANLRFIDSTGIGILVTDLKRLVAEGGSMAVRNVGPRAYRVFEVTGLVELLSVTPLALEAPTVSGVDELGAPPSASVV